jgi:UDP-glucose:(heptosyl)LPS alpha-1,3-glucosyltransferase
MTTAAEQASPANKRLRVAVLSRTFSPTGGGAERYSIAMVEQLADLHEVHVFAQVIEHRCPGVTYHLISTPLRKPRWINQLWFATATWWATRTVFDVVHSHENTWHGNVQTVHVLPVKYNLFHGRRGVRLALRWVKVVTSPRLLTYLALEQLRYAKKSHRHVVVTSASLRTIMMRSYPACEPMLSVITPGIDLPNLAQTADGQDIERLAARRRLSLPPTGTCLLFIANDFRKKGLNTVLEALVRLPEDTVLAVVGNPNQTHDFSRTLNTLKLGQRVFFLGRMNDVSDAYLAADCLVHPTLEDTFAMVVLEALSHGLPCVVSGPEFCGISSLLENRINALLLNDPRDSNALSALLQELATDTNLRHNLSVQALTFAAQYQWSAIAARQDVVYQASQKNH